MGSWRESTCGKSIVFLFFFYAGAIASSMCLVDYHSYQTRALCLTRLDKLYHGLLTASKQTLFPISRCNSHYLIIVLHVIATENLSKKIDTNLYLRSMDF